MGLLFVYRFCYSQSANSIILVNRVLDPSIALSYKMMRVRKLLMFDV